MEFIKWFNEICKAHKYKCEITESCNEKYSDLAEFINDNDINSVEELKKSLVKLNDKRDNVRNNRDWDYYSNLIQ